MPAPLGQLNKCPNAVSRMGTTVTNDQLLQRAACNLLQRATGEACERHQLAKFLMRSHLA